MAKKPKIPRSETVAFVAEHLKRDASIAMSELKKLGRAAGHNIYGLIVGLARKSLGMKRATPKPRAGRGPGLPPGKRGPGRPPGKRGPGRPPGKRGPGRPRKATSYAGLDGVVAHLRGLERQVESLRHALTKIADIAAGA